jgi:hypothetical protein
VSAVVARTSALSSTRRIDSSLVSICIRSSIEGVAADFSLGSAMGENREIVVPWPYLTPIEHGLWNLE